MHACISLCIHVCLFFLFVCSFVCSFVLIALLLMNYLLVYSYMHVGAHAQAELSLHNWNDTLKYAVFNPSLIPKLCPFNVTASGHHNVTRQ